MKNFVSIDTIVSGVLLDINDEDHKKYYTRAAQWSLDAFRRLNVNHSSAYLERKVTLNPDNYYFDIPPDLVKLLSVGIYRHGEFWAFTKKPDMSLLPSDLEDDIYVPDNSENRQIPERGHRFGKSSSNVFGYYIEDSEHCRVFVRSSRYLKSRDITIDTTSNILDKVIIRYKTTGINCDKEICVPIEMQDLITTMVAYKFAMRNIPFKMTADEKDRYERMIESLQEEYEALMYEPHNFWEVKDAIFGSQNITARR